MDEVTKGLEKAATLVEQGWCQGHYTDLFEGKTRYCPVGAINAIRVSAQLKDEMYNRLRRHVPEGVGGHPSITCFNDKSSTTKEDILLLFKKAINDCG